MLILAGDVGGTKTRLGIYDYSGNAQFKRTVVERFESTATASFEEIALTFLKKNGLAGKDIAACCFGVPGPVVNGTVKLTNLPWVLDEKKIASTLGIAKTFLANDLEATISAAPTFCPEDLVVLHPGKEDRNKNVFAILAPGTGLGQGYLIKTRDNRYHAFPSEGGHVEFAPKTELEFDLLKHMQRKLKKRVSIERVLCGPGLVNIYTFLRDHGYNDEPPELKQELSAKDAAAAIAKSGLAGEYEICVKALDMFASLLGSQAGDVVLSYLSTGGMYLGGGIPPKILPKLLEGGLVEAYLKKGRLSPLVEATPLYVIKDDHAALLGAATLAASLIEK
jgi:glucokinase